MNKEIEVDPMTIMFMSSKKKDEKLTKEEEYFLTNKNASKPTFDAKKFYDALTDARIETIKEKLGIA